MQPRLWIRIRLARADPVARGCCARAPERLWRSTRERLFEPRSDNRPCGLFELGEGRILHRLDASRPPQELHQWACRRRLITIGEADLDRMQPPTAPLGPAVASHCPLRIDLGRRIVERHFLTLPDRVQGEELTLRSEMGIGCATVIELVERRIGIHPQSRPQPDEIRILAGPRICGTKPRASEPKY